MGMNGISKIVHMKFIYAALSALNDRSTITGFRRDLNRRPYARRRGVVTSTPLWRSQPYSLCIQCEYVHVRIQFLHYKFEISKKSLLLTDIIRVFPGQFFRVFPVSL